VKRVLILGATSAIAQEAARIFAARGDELMLVARNAERLAAVADDLRARGAARVEVQVHDLNAASEHEAIFSRAFAAGGRLDVVLLAHGVLGDPAEYERTPAAAELVLRTNLVSPVSLLTIAAQRLEAGACIAAISSVAGDRGRGSNSIYGASKAGLDAFLSGLRNRLFARGIRVVTVKPGFVDTPMTAQAPKNALFASAREVGEGIVRAIDRGGDVVYLPWFWRFIMLLVRSIPEAFFKRLKL
jgi:short-subunit dehydrogenase